MYQDAVLKEIDNTYLTFSGGDIIMNFEAEIVGLTVGKIQRLGLAVGNSLLFTTANTGGISVSNTPIFVLYQIRLGITQG